MDQTQLAEAIRAPFRRVNEIVAGKRGLTPSTALRLSRYFGNKTGFWLNLQMRCDLQSAEDSERDALRKIERASQMN
ncbi:MAG: HigA family addiction module antidote protein [Blastocatellia bacterium]|nr:HigA family addiction module antidote protein [Blastocatellia bacterium]